MRAILACAVAALLAGCATAPDDLRSGDRIGPVLLRGDTATAARCIGETIHQHRRTGDAAFHAQADLLGVRATCGNRLCVVVDLTTASGGTLATGYANRWPSIWAPDALRDTLEACKA